jgi:hypothetical protein
MQLSEFIESTMYEIALGVERARLRARNLAAINPSTIDGQQINERSYVQFDVSVVVSDSEEVRKGGDAKVGAEIKVASIAKVSVGAGGKVESAVGAKSEQTHRVAFQVPMYMNANYRNNPAVQAEAEAFSLEGFSLAPSADAQPKS